MARIPKTPKLLDRKIYKTGQTRGADDDQIYQNRVGRASTVLIPLSVYVAHEAIRQLNYENGFIVLVRPSEYFEDYGDAGLEDYGLTLGENALIFYELREDWLRWNPEQRGYQEPTSRRSPLGGQYVARIANTTAAGDERINRGYTSTGLKGAGIRLFEYAPNDIIAQCRTQLEAIFWCAADASEEMIAAGMTPEDVQARREAVFKNATDQGLFDTDRLRETRLINENNELICPLCMDRVSAAGFLNRLAQAAGRERHDLTVTEINLFHIVELAYGAWNHRPYNLGWGHHHCNVVCKDSGIFPTLEWMRGVLRRNGEAI